MTARHISVTIREDYLIEDGLKIISDLRPKWLEAQDKNGVEIVTKVFSDGITNRLFGVRLATAPLKDMVMIKVYGNKTDLMIDRTAEIDSFRILHQNGCGAQLYATFENGNCYEFIPGCCLTMENCRDSNVYPLVAREMAQLHKTIVLPEESRSTSAIWSKMQIFCKLNEDILNENKMLSDRLQKEYDYTVETVKKDIEELKDILEKENMPIAFCHNDLSLNNVIYNKEESYAKFIDFEYAFSNYGPFDVANHILEFCGLDKPDYSLLPKREFRSEWISHYLSVYETEGFTQNQFERWVELCVPLSDLFWTLWCVIQAHVSNIEFDFVGYTGLRYNKYKQIMKEIRNGSYSPE